MLETEAALGGEGIAVVLGRLDMLNLANLANPRASKVLFAVERRRLEECATRAQNPCTLPKGRLVVRDVLQNFQADNEVEAAVGEGQGIMTTCPAGQLALP